MKLRATLFLILCLSIKVPDVLAEDDPISSFWTQAEDAAVKKSDEGIRLIRQGHAEEALQLFEEAVTLDPCKSGLWANLGTCQLELNRPSDALASFSRGLSIDPTSSVLVENIRELEAHDSSGRVANDLSGETVKSVDGSGAQSGISSAEIIRTLTNDAIELAEAGKITEALELFEQAVDTDTSNGRAWEGLGVTHLRMGNLAESRLALEKAKSLLPNDASILGNLVALAEHEEWHQNNQGSSKAGSMVR